MSAIGTSAGTSDRPRSQICLRSFSPKVRAERVLDVEQVLDLHDDQEDLRFVSAALDALPQLPEEAGAVEHARAPHRAR